MEKYFFMKLLIILCLICAILLICTKINEEFSDLAPSPIRVNITTNKSKDRLILKWTKSSNDIEKYFIVFYRNNNGPFIITLPNLDIANNRVFKYEYYNIDMNVDYKFGVLAYNSRRLFSTINDFTKVKLTPPGLQIEYIKDVVSKVTCNPDGSFDIRNSNQCIENENIIHARTVNNDGSYADFNLDDHNSMMQNLNNDQQLIFNFK